MKRLLAIPLLLVAFCCAPHLPPVLGPTSIVDRVLRSIVKVSYLQDNGQTFLCTGFVVDAAKGRALTARHCVADLPVVQVDGNDSLVMVAGETLALITVPSMSKPPLEIRSDTPSVGEPVQAFGYGWGDMFVLTRYVAAISTDGNDIALDNSLIPGMSGGPVVDSRARVIGLNQKSTDSPSIGILCGQGEIRAFLKDNMK